MRKKQAIIISVIIFLVLTISFYLDSEIVKRISLIRNSLLNDFLLKIDLIGSSIIIIFFMVALFIWKKNKRRWIIPLLVAMASSVFFSFILKTTIQRLRPFQQGIISLIFELEKNSYFLWDFSFPSFHSMLAFCTIPFLSKEFPKFKYVWIGIAGLIAFSRIYFGLHFLSDVLVGGLFGYFIGLLVLKIEEKNKFVEKIHKKIFKK